MVQKAKSHVIGSLLAGALVVGVLDIAYAIGFWWFRNRVSPVRILQSVAAGLLGPDAARSGGLATATLGTFLHFFIALSIVVVYWAASRAIPLLVQRPIVCGAMYGLGVYAVMNYAVIPLSHASSGGRPLLLWIVCSVAVHAFFVGIPAALFARRATVTETGRSHQIHGSSAVGP